MEMEDKYIRSRSDDWNHGYLLDNQRSNDAVRYFNRPGIVVLECKGESWKKKKNKEIKKGKEKEKRKE